MAYYERGFSFLSLYHNQTLRMCVRVCLNEKQIYISAAVAKDMYILYTWMLRSRK